MEKNEIFISSVDCAIFFRPTISIDKKVKLALLEKITEKCGELLNGEPTLLPIPLDAPLEIPRLQLNSKDNSFFWGISMLRSDLKFDESGEPNKKISDISEKLFKYFNEILTLYTEEFDWGIGRLAFVVNYFSELNDRASDFITSNFLRDMPVFKSIELSFLKKDNIGGINVNRWLRMKCAEKNDHLLHLLFDINTHAEEKLNLNVEQMMDLFDNFILYIEKEITGTFGGTLNA